VTSAFANPDSSKTLTWKLVSFDVNGKANSETGGTPQGTIIIGSAAGTLDLRKMLAASGLDVYVGPSGKIEIPPSAVTSTKIADNSISTPKLQANAVTANTVAAGAIVAGKVAANAIGASEIIAGVIASDKLDVNFINVGGGGGKPGQFRIFNASGVQIGFIGVDGGFNGAWFREFRVGGTSASNAKLVADSSGNLSIVDATFSLNLNGVTTEIDNAFDTYGFPGLTVRFNSGTNRVIVLPDAIYGLSSGGSGTPFYMTGIGGEGYLSVRGSFSRIFEINTSSALVNIFNMSMTVQGSIESITNFQCNGDVVVRSQRNGWSLPSGTSSRSGFTTSTVTTAELAERVKALIEDLHEALGHGLIGY
jgi:hypothetical protein